MRSTLAFTSILVLSACGGSTTPVYTVFIQGHLKGTDLTASQKIHDAAAQGAQQKAQSQGDLSHYTYLGVPLPPATQSDGFLAIDRWTSLPNLTQFYTDPALQTAFGSLLSGPPTILITTEPSGWNEYGKLDPAGQGDPLFLFLIQGQVSAASAAAAQSSHDQVVTTVKPQATQAGDVAHLAFLNPQDPTQLNAVDLWTNLTGPASVYSNPQVLAAFGSVFSGVPSVTPYQHSKWYQY